MFIACLAGYIWIYYVLLGNHNGNKSVEVCLIKHFTTIACPSCGSTRAVILIIQGKYLDALKINPLGYLVAMIMIFVPIWIIIDLGLGRKTLFVFYHKVELFLQRPQYSIPLILLILIIWILNNIKGL